ncbi:uncharacterized protein LOC135349888 isoform X2 [Halichondria panicea]
MTVTFTLCQLEHVLMSRGRLMSSSALSCVDCHCQRLCEYCGVEWVGLTASLPHLVSCLTGRKDLLLKMAYLAAVLLMRTSDTRRKGRALMSTLFSDLQPQQESHDLVDEGSHASNGINLALAVKDHLNADCGDLQYLKAWRLFCDGEYTKVLSTLRTATPSPTTNLLRGHCLANLSKPQSAQCCYLSCLTSHCQVASLPAMTASCALYRHASNTEAEMEAMTLKLEALRSTCGCVVEGVLWWRGEGLHDDPALISDIQWAESAYNTALRALKHRRYEMAGRVLRDLLACGPLCPPLPPSSLIHLLLARTLLLSGNPIEAWEVCERLIDHLSILELEECTLHSVLSLCQSLLLGALSLVARGDWDKAKCSSHKSYQVCGFLISRLSRDTEGVADSLQPAVLAIMELNLVLMAGLCVGGGERDKALSLLTTTVSLTPTPSLLTLYNYALLLTQRGKLKEAANSWLGKRGQLPSNKTEARHMIVDKKKSANPGDFERFDVAMLRVWIRQCSS